MQSTSYCKVHFVGERSVSVVRVPSPSKRTPRRVPRRARRCLRDACSGTCGSGGCPLRQSLTCASLPGRRVSFSHRRRLHVPGPRGSRRCRGAAPHRRRTSAPEAIPGRDRPGPSSHSRPQPCTEPMRTFARGGASPFRGGSEDGGMLGGAGSRAHQGMELPAHACPPAGCPLDPCLDAGDWRRIRSRAPVGGRLPLQRLDTPMGLRATRSPGGRHGVAAVWTF